MKVNQASRQQATQSTAKLPEQESTSEKADSANFEKQLNKANQENSNANSSNTNLPPQTKAEPQTEASANQNVNENENENENADTNSPQATNDNENIESLPPARRAAYEAGQAKIEAEKLVTQSKDDIANKATKAENLTEKTTDQGQARKSFSVPDTGSENSKTYPESTLTKGLSTEGLEQMAKPEAIDSVKASETQSAQSGEEALKTSLAERGIDYDSLSAESKEIIKQNGGIVDTVKSKDDLTVADIQQAAEGAKGLEIKSVDGLTADNGEDLFGAATANGEVLLEAGLDNAKDTLKSVAIEEISDNAFQQIAQIEAKAGNKLAGSTSGYLSAGDFGQEVALRAEGTATKASLAELKNASSNDTIMVNGVKAEANTSAETVSRNVQAVWDAHQIFPFDKNNVAPGGPRASLIRNTHNSVMSKALTAAQSMNAAKGGGTNLKAQADSLGNAINAWGGKLNTYEGNAANAGDTTTGNVVRQAGRDFGTIATGKKQDGGLSPTNAQRLHNQLKNLRDSPEGSGTSNGARSALQNALTTFNQAGDDALKGANVRPPSTFTPPVIPTDTGLMAGPSQKISPPANRDKTGRRFDIVNSGGGNFGLGGNVSAAQLQNAAVQGTLFGLTTVGGGLANAFGAAASGIAAGSIGLGVGAGLAGSASFAVVGAGIQAGLLIQQAQNLPPDYEDSAFVQNSSTKFRITAANDAEAEKIAQELVRTERVGFIDAVEGAYGDGSSADGFAIQDNKWVEDGGGFGGTFRRTGQTSPTTGLQIYEVTVTVRPPERDRKGNPNDGNVNSQFQLS